MCGYDVMFLTGTDEHGQKIEETAKNAGFSPREFVDRIVEGPRGVKDLWKLMNISNDRFIRPLMTIMSRPYSASSERCTTTGISIRMSIRARTANPARAFGQKASLKRASVRTAAGKSALRKRKHTFSVFPSMREGFANFFSAESF